MKDKIIIMICLLFLLIGCYQYQKESKEKISTTVCTNEELWDNRINYDDFDCKLTYLEGQKALRQCTATTKQLIGTNIDNFDIKIVTLNTTCLTTCYANCYCDDNCYPRGARLY